MWLKYKLRNSSITKYYLLSEGELDFLNNSSCAEIQRLSSDRSDIDRLNFPIPLQDFHINDIEYFVIPNPPLEYLQKEIKRLDNSIYYDTCQRDIYLQMIQERKYDKS